MFGVLEEKVYGKRQMKVGAKTEKNKKKEERKHVNEDNGIKERETEKR